MTQGAERFVSVLEMMEIGLNRTNAKRLDDMRKPKSILKAVTTTNNGRHSKGGYAIDKNGSPLDKSLIKRLK